MEERHKYAKRKKRESSEKRAVLKERRKYAAQNNENQLPHKRTLTAKYTSYDMDM